MALSSLVVNDVKTGIGHIKTLFTPVTMQVNAKMTGHAIVFKYIASLQMP
jgi:hypothetical protein